MSNAGDTVPQSTTMQVPRGSLGMAAWQTQHSRCAKRMVPKETQTEREWDCEMRPWPLSDAATDASTCVPDRDSHSRNVDFETGSLQPPSDPLATESIPVYLGQPTAGCRLSAVLRAKGGKRQRKRRTSANRGLHRNNHRRLAGNNVSDAVLWTTNWVLVLFAAYICR